MTIREKVTRTISSMPESELRQVAGFLEFLKFRSRIRKSRLADPNRLADLYAEFSAEDSEMAEEGIDDYNKMLNSEDKL